MTEVTRQYGIGSGIVEAHEAKILADLPAMYPDEGQRQIVESVLLPHFREELVKVLDQFRESEKLDLDQPVVPSRLPGLCGAVDGMIEGNKALLDLGGMFKPVIERIQVVRVEIAEALKEQFYQHCREILAGHEVVDRQWLMYKGAVWFTSADFSPYGKGKAFAREILGKSLGNIGAAVLEEIADALGFEKLSMERYRKVLAEHGVTDRQSLLDKGVVWFARTDFPPYGKGVAFAGKILGKPVGSCVSLTDLNGIADALGFEKPSMEQYRKVLAEHGVTDRQGLLGKGPVWFTSADFSPYGKGKAFARKILGRTIGDVCISDLEEIADALSFEKLSMGRYRKVLAEHGVADRQSLLSRGVTWFRKTDFPPYGKGFAFAGEILRRSIGSQVHVADLNEIAGILWPVSSNEN